MRNTKIKNRVFMRFAICDDGVDDRLGVAAAGVAAGEVRNILEQPEGHLLVVVDDSLFSNPIQCGISQKSL